MVASSRGKESSGLGGRRGLVYRRELGARFGVCLNVLFASIVDFRYVRG